MKICKDCNHLIVPEGVGTMHEQWWLPSAKCGHSTARKLDLVSGATFQMLCGQNRLDACGTGGKYFEPKQI